ncbi:MAG: hypothetical protein QXY07_02595 [Candidatus Bathyarchaeia archaeon]
MGSCPNCGRKVGFFSKDNCHVCGKTVCPECEIPLFKVGDASAKSSRLKPEYVVKVCSEECFTSFLNEIKTIINQNEIFSTYLTLDETYITEALKRAYVTYLRARKDNKLLKSIFILVNFWYERNRLYLEWPLLTTEYKNYSTLLYEELYKHFFELKWKEEEAKLLDDARYYERVGRYEDAAKVYEKLANMYEYWKLYDKAREMRDRARQLLREKIHVVTVDLNKILEQVRNGGLVVVYRCPNCGGKIKIDKGTELSKLQICEYCGFTLEPVDVADFLKKAMG